MRKTIYITIIISCSSAYANYLDIGTAPSGAKISINTDNRYFTKIQPEQLYKYGTNGDMIYKFWNKAIFKTPFKAKFCVEYLGLRCLKVSEFYINKVVYLSFFNLTQNTYCDERTQFFDKNGTNVSNNGFDGKCDKFNFRSIEPDGDNDFINTYLIKMNLNNPTSNNTASENKSPYTFKN